MGWRTRRSAATSRWPEVARQLRQAGPLVRAERRALRARLGAEWTEREVIEAVIEATGLHTRDNALRLIDPAILVRDFDNDRAASAAAPPDPSRLQRLGPDLALLRRRAAGESLRRLARDYGVAHTTLARLFARPEVAGQLSLLRLRSRAPSGRHIRWSQQTGQRDKLQALPRARRCRFPCGVPVPMPTKSAQEVRRVSVVAVPVMPLCRAGRRERPGTSGSLGGR
jgi:hypothetical protein